MPRESNFWLWGMVLFAIGAVAAEAQVPPTASPGAPDRAAVVEGRCPTFSWGLIPEAEAYELVVYDLGAVGEPIEGSRGLRRRLAGGVTSWTPAFDGCLRPGRRYAWSVRALVAGSPSDWSSALLFRTREAPSLSEVERAIDVLLRAREAEVPDASFGAPTPSAPDLAHVPLAAAALTRRSAPRLFSRSAPGRSAAARAPTPAAPPVLGPISLTVSDDVALAEATDVFKGSEVFLYDDEGTTGVGRGALGSNQLDTGADEGINNTGVGSHALGSNLTGSDNTAVGIDALGQNEITSRNTAVGAEALAGAELIGPSGGGDNTAVGARALRDGVAVDVTTAVGSRALEKVDGAQGNTAVGALALRNNLNAAFNVAVGLSALQDLDSAHPGFSANGSNVAVGSSALAQITEGEGNIAIGDLAGYSLGGVSPTTTSLSHNIYLGSSGAADEEHTMRLGTPYVSGPGFAAGQTRTFIAGILGNTTTGTHEVHVGTGGEIVQGAAVVSSRRFKREIADVGSASERIWELRPVVYRLDERLAGPDSGRHYGLIAEEVAEVLPELVTFDREGRPYTVDYRALSVLLLNELRELRAKIESAPGG